MEPRQYELQGTIKNVHIIRNFTLTVASCISVIMPGDFKVVCIKQMFHFNSVQGPTVVVSTLHVQEMTSQMK